MAVIPRDEQRLTFAQLAQSIKPHPCKQTVENWYRFGLLCDGSHNRVYLEASKQGGRLFTSWEAYLRFEAKLNGE